jgi:hypothetical protein
LRDIVNGGGANKLISAQDLVTAGIADLTKSGILSAVVPEGVVYGPPPAPTNVAASAAIQNVIVTWDDPAYPGHAYAEVWGASTDNLGAAVVLGLTPGAVYTDPLGPGATRYYWVRFVNVQDLVGPYNAVNGTIATTGADVDYLLDVLAGQITEGELFTDLNTRLNKIETTESKYTVKIDNAGHISGFGLISTANDAAPYASFGVRANQFFIAPPSVVQSSAPTVNLYKGFVWVDSSVTPNVTRYYNGTTWVTTPQALPFVVQATPTVVGGITTVPAGVYMDAAFIKNATITNAKIADLAVDDAKIDSLSVTKLNAGSLKVGSYISSSNYVAGSTGFKIDAAGSAEFSSATVRGAVYATDGEFTGTVKAGTTILGGGATNYSTGTGFFGGVVAGTYKWRVGDPAGNRVDWDGTNLTIVPSFTVTTANIQDAMVSGAITLALDANNYIKIDGPNQRIDVYGGGALRVRLGKL